LASHFLEQASRRLHLPLPRFTEAHVRLMQSYHWPGNVRELQNAIERAVILAQGGLLRFDLPGKHQLTAVVHQPQNGSGNGVLTELELRKLETQNLMAALAKTSWTIHGKSGAAKLLGVKPTTLISRIKKLGLKKPG